jgi:hypothetical protein
MRGRIFRARLLAWLDYKGGSVLETNMPTPRLAMSGVEDSGGHEA